MRVCVLHNNYYRSSGSAIVLRRLFEAFSGTPVEFHFVGGGALTEGGIPSNDNKDWMPAGRYSQFTLMGSASQSWTELKKFVRWINANNFDVIHAHHRRLACLANLTFKWHGVPVLYTAHNTFPWSAWFWLGAPKAVTGVSPSVASYLKRATQSASQPVVWNPHAFPKAQRKELTNTSLRTAISVGRLEPIKGHRELILAWNRLKTLGIDAQLRIFGEGHQREELQGLVRANHLDQDVELCGFRNDLKSELATNLFNVLASRTEGFPNVVVEAASWNTATLVTDVDGSRDTVPSNAVLPNKVKFGDIEGLAKALAHWFKNPELVLEEGTRFREFLLQKCSPERVRDVYLEIYNSLSSQTQRKLNAARPEQSRAGDLPLSL